MYLIRITSLIFALGLMISKLFAVPAELPETMQGTVKVRTYQVQPFTSVELEGAFKVVLEQGDEYGLKIKTDEDNFRHIDVQSDASALRLKITKRRLDFDELTLYITFKDLKELKMEGGISLDSNGYLDFNDFTLRVQGGATIDMNLKADYFKLVSEGGVKLDFDGIVKEFNAVISGAGFLDALNLKSRDCTIKIEGVGTASVFATDNLNAIINGVGKIRYKGEPRISKIIEGIGSVSQD